MRGGFVVGLVDSADVDSTSVAASIFNDSGSGFSVESLRGEKKANSVFMVVLDVVAVYQIGLAVDLYFKKPVRKINKRKKLWQKIEKQKKI